MDSKITLSFDKHVINEAKAFAAKNGMSLSRLTEFIYKQMTTQHYKSLEELPIAEWIDTVAEGGAEYTKSSSRKQLKSEFYNSRK
ncbi:hypothetical protein G5B30_15615 [Sphingobacterium sp. SGG-5]|uniref:DUF6364 family protein n=1 Tax=Sphingobacterium sp. SGG-5 TaxID=2710881 RepID=UPI0013EBFFF0|nr:DUF6364 family protein [Sphingobacterium sp. SGG-5]NGM63337.1 hypothetical protein [Sphingobacterium sp. SGG-5]